MLKVCICELRIISELHLILYIGKYNLFFQASIPPLGFQTYFVVASSAESDTYLLFFFYSLQVLSHLSQIFFFYSKSKNIRDNCRSGYSAQQWVPLGHHLRIHRPSLQRQQHSIFALRSSQSERMVFSSTSSLLFNTSVPILLSSF